MNADFPTVTILIATYNKSSTLRLAVESVLWQTFADFELWVIGDGCTDDTTAVMQRFDDPRVHWYNLPENTGDQSAPHNEGLRRARGRYIAYLNHDDLWLPNHLQILKDTLEARDADFAFSILEWIIPGREPYAVIPDYPDAPIPPEATATLHRKSVVDRIGYWRPPHAVYSFPRADYFRRAQFNGMKFVLAPALTALKFGVSKTSYSIETQQTEYLERVRSDPDFAHRETAALLARVQHELERPVTLKRWRGQLSLAVKRAMAKRRI
ncbi:MAG: glycosyltransferase family 2 protein, partial [Anaerolineales bacterium]